MTTDGRIQKKTIVFRSDVHQDYISRSMHKATCAVNRLMRDGFVIEQVNLGGGGQPKISILWHPRVTHLGVVRSVRRGNDGRPYEQCLVEFEGCQVSWERS